MIDAFLLIVLTAIVGIALLLSLIMLTMAIVVYRANLPWPPESIRIARQVIALHMVVIIMIAIVPDWRTVLMLTIASWAAQALSYVLMIHSGQPRGRWRRKLSAARARLRRVSAWRPPVLQPAGT